MTDTREVIITVRESAVSRRGPERATVSLTVALEGPDKASVHDGVAVAARRVSEGIGALHAPDAGPVTWWSHDRLRTWSQRPWNQDGEQLPLVHHAATSFSVKFSDFVALGAWLAEIGPVTGVRVDGIQWALTERHHAELEIETRARAVTLAREKAQAYAGSAGLGEVRVVAIADTGMLGDVGGVSGYSSGPGVAGRGAFAASGNATPHEFAPEDIVITASVDARFVATG